MALGPTVAPRTRTYCMCTRYSYRMGVLKLFVICAGNDCTNFSAPKHFVGTTVLFMFVFNKNVLPRRKGTYFRHKGPRLLG